MKNIANDLAIFLHIQGLKMRDDHWENVWGATGQKKLGFFETREI